MRSNLRKKKKKGEMCRKEKTTKGTEAGEASRHDEFVILKRRSHAMGGGERDGKKRRRGEKGEGSFTFQKIRGKKVG